MKASAMRLSILVALVLGCTVIGLFSRRAFSQSPAATSKPAATSEVGRYQMFVMTNSNGSSGALVLFDTKTGQCWRKEGVPNPGTDDAGWENISPTWTKSK